MSRILLFTENLGSGGAERQLTGLAVQLLHKGYQVKVLTYVENQFFEPYLRENNVEYELNTKIHRGIKGMLILYKSIREYSPDSIISFLPLPNIRMCLVNLFLRKKLIVSERSHTLKWNLSTKIRFIPYMLSTYVVANSYSEQDNITSHFRLLKHKTITIPNFVDTEKYSPTSFSGTNVIRFVSVGRLIPSKNVIGFLTALSVVLKKGYDIKLVWVGSQYDKQYLSEVEKFISAKGLENAVTLKDQTMDVVAEYRSGNVFCFPTLYEGYPNVLCEAMSCGLPVLCSNVCEMSKIIVEGENGFLFNPMNIKEMAEAIERMLKLSSEERKAMGQRNRQKVIENNSKEKFVAKYIELL